MSLLFDKVALVTGASRGVGYAAAKKLCEKFPGATIYLATKNQEISPEMNKKMRQDFPDSSEHCEYIKMDVSDKKTIEDLKELIRERHETLDILVNNAGRYELPDTSLPTFGQQAEVILNTNYWGLKNVINGMRGIFTPGARVVNTSSHLGHLSLINGEAKKSLILREMLADPGITEDSLDELMTQFQTLATAGGWEREGWPDCAYTVSKVAVNVYTRILQRDFDEEGHGVVVNSVYPGTKHSKIQQQSVVPLEDGAYAIANACCVPDKGMKGQIFWHNLQPVNWEEAVNKPSLLNSAAHKHN